jgi:5-methylcytosine-specific restriction endonuclease McrA
MPFKQIKKFFTGPAPHLSREEALRVFQRDHFKCRYCGLDGLHRFENWLILTVDHFHPHAKGGSRSMDNLVTACQPCNLIKGKRVFKSLEEAKDFVLEKRAEWQAVFQEHTRAAAAAKSAH